jgi:hypothetical protein
LLAYHRASEKNRLFYWRKKITWLPNNFKFDSTKILATINVAGKIRLDYPSVTLWNFNLRQTARIVPMDWNYMPKNKMGLFYFHRRAKDFIKLKVVGAYKLERPTSKMIFLSLALEMLN